MVSEKESVLRRCTFKPLGNGGPVFRLVTWDANRTDTLGKHMLGYELTVKMSESAPAIVLFRGEDFGCSPKHAIDSDAAVEGIMSFLTLRPGDTDEEYFAGYTPDQRAFCEEHAEALSCEVRARFCDEDGNVKRSA